MAQPPDFVAGSVLTAAQMNKVGAWLISTTTVGSAVSTIPVANCFSSDYENYRIVWTGGVGSASNYVLMTLGATVTGYYDALTVYTFNNTAAGGGRANQASWIVGYHTATAALVDITVYRPNAADETLFTGNIVSALATTAGYAGACGGLLNNTTAYTGFTLAPTSGTLTGGTVYVYGLRD